MLSRKFSTVACNDRSVCEAAVMKTFVIGRSPYADVVIADVSVGSHHAEIIVTADNRLHLTDCGEETGTWLCYGATSETGPQWRRIRQAFIRPDDLLRFGNHVSTAEVLLRAVRHYDGPASGGHRPGGWQSGMTRRVVRGRVQRDPATGEIVRRRP